MLPAIATAGGSGVASGLFSSAIPAAGTGGISAGLGSIIGGGLGAAGSLFGSILSGDQSEEVARDNRRFVERMSNTAYQRAAADLEAAGLNRILAIGSPASTPSGAMPTIPDYGQSMASGAKAMADIALQRDQSSLIKAQTVGTLAAARKADADTYAVMSDRQKSDPANRMLGRILNWAEQMFDKNQQYTDKALQTLINSSSTNARDLQYQFDDWLGGSGLVPLMLKHPINMGRWDELPNHYDK